MVADDNDDDEWGNETQNSSVQLKKKESDSSMNILKYREQSGIGGMSGK